jgi:hypothetical protein
LAHYFAWGILIAFLAVLIDLLGPPIGIFITTRMEARKVPAVKIATRELPDYSVSDAPGMKLSYFGYEFAVPWNASFKERRGKALVQLKFQSGQDVLFVVPSGQGGLLTEIVQDQSLKLGDLQFVFGDLMNRSAYDQYRVLLNTTPQSIRAFGQRAEAVRGVTLLTIKRSLSARSWEQGRSRLRYLANTGFKSVILRNRDAWT